MLCSGTFSFAHVMFFIGNREKSWQRYYYTLPNPKQAAKTVFKSTLPWQQYEWYRFKLSLYFQILLSNEFALGKEELWQYAEKWASRSKRKAILLEALQNGHPSKYRSNPIRWGLTPGRDCLITEPLTDSQISAFYKAWYPEQDINVYHSWDTYACTSIAQFKSTVY